MSFSPRMARSTFLAVERRITLAAVVLGIYVFNRQAPRIAENL